VSIAHKYLCETVKILHCDISIGNILLHRPDENKEANGLLVDFDFAKTIEGGKSSGDACDASDGNDKGLSEVGEATTQPTGTKSCINGVWTVSGVYAYQTPSITLFLGNSPLCCRRSLTPVSKALHAATLS
jgi:hypothetical protein